MTTHPAVTKELARHEQRESTLHVRSCSCGGQGLATWPEHVTQALDDAGHLSAEHPPAMTLTEAAEVLARASGWKVRSGRDPVVQRTLADPSYAREVYDLARDLTTDDRASFEQVERAGRLLGVTR